VEVAYIVVEVVDDHNTVEEVEVADHNIDVECMTFLYNVYSSIC
jgi:hypothetical protein